LEAVGRSIRSSGALSRLQIRKVSARVKERVLKFLKEKKR